MTAQANFMTTDEAGKRACPFARALAPAVNHDGETIGCASVNRDPYGHIDRDTVCVASECMAWRWNTKTTGYCGLAGKP